ncbi:MAG: MoxR family ATPase, partial [Okeania sp. SIO1H6]|nr:MoxR family ATPase [Okeania sp. SIO1H6]
LEEGSFEIPELVRIKKEVDKVTVRTAYTDATEEKTGSQMEAEVENGRITCTAFPFVVMTSNGERDFPAPFLRRCLRLRMKSPTQEELTRIVTAHFNQATAEQEKIQTLIEDFINLREEGTLATDQLLNAIFMVKEGRIPATEGKKFSEDKLVKQLFQDLGRVEDED